MSITKANTTTRTIRFNTEDIKLIEDYAKFQNKSFSDVVRESVDKAIEEDFDKQILAEYFESVDKDPTLEKEYTYDEFLSRIGKSDND